MRTHAVCAMLCFSLFWCSAAEVQSAGNEPVRESIEITSSGQTVTVPDCLYRESSEDGKKEIFIAKEKEKPLLGDIVAVSLTELEKGIFYVSGLTADGVSSHWGRARQDGACFAGSDFRICRKR